MNDLEFKDKVISLLQEISDKLGEKPNPILQSKLDYIARYGYIPQEMLDWTDSLSKENLQGLDYHIDWDTKEVVPD